ncbi:MAG TPA: hypothetical protein VGE65_03520 [Sphingobium sp.]
MSLNQILHDEQMAMIRHASATSPIDLARHRGEIDRISRMLSPFSYPHRPYVSAVPRMAIAARAEGAVS